MANTSRPTPNYALRRTVVLGVSLALVVILALGIAAILDDTADPDSSAVDSVSAVTTDNSQENSQDDDPAAIGLSLEELADVRPNEVGIIPVLEYHLIEPGENSEFSRTPESFRADLEWLVEHDFFPIRFRDLSSGHFDVPAGKSPVVLTFDDSSIGQFRMLDDGTVDPLCALGIMLDVAAAHRLFPAVATFFPLLDVDVDERILWGQPDSANDKLAMIISLGGEIGSHTVSHERLDQVDDDRVQWQLATSSAILEDRIAEFADKPYEIVSFAVPLGMYPANESLLRSGSADGQTYEFSGVAEVAGGPTVSPFGIELRPVPRHSHAGDRRLPRRRLRAVGRTRRHGVRVRRRSQHHHRSERCHAHRRAARRLRCSRRLGRRQDRSLRPPVIGRLHSDDRKTVDEG